MPFYIDAIHPYDAWYTDVDKLRNKEVSLQSVKPGPKGGWLFVRTGNLNRIFYAVKLRWEDYPSEECRAGLLDPPTSSIIDNARGFGKARYKLPKTLDI